jgi:hypothetical protein
MKSIGVAENVAPLFYIKENSYPKGEEPFNQYCSHCIDAKVLECKSIDIRKKFKVRDI